MFAQVSQASEAGLSPTAILSAIARVECKPSISDARDGAQQVDVTPSRVSCCHDSEYCGGVHAGVTGTRRYPLLSHKTCRFTCLECMKQGRQSWPHVAELESDGALL